MLDIHLIEALELNLQHDDANILAETIQFIGSLIQVIQNTLALNNRKREI